jgi:N-glycosylase/DNA lyase
VAVFYYNLSGTVVERSLPDPDEMVLQGVVWGAPEVAFTPAYWVTQYWMRDDTYPLHQRLGESLEEEVVACLLGGYGIPAEIGLAAFARLKERDLVTAGGQRYREIAEALLSPLTIDGRQVRYRFWAQRARYIAGALVVLADSAPPTHSATSLRSYLLAIPGIGPKTASWIVRNWLASDDVAILDIHIVRAGQLMGLYSRSENVTDRYFEMERRFLDFAKALNVPAARLDALIWAHMRAWGHDPTRSRQAHQSPNHELAAR